MNIFDTLLARVALLSRTDGCPIEAVRHVAFDAKTEFDAEFGSGNRYSISLSRLMLRLDDSPDRRERVDTAFRVTELLGAASQRFRRGGASRDYGGDFADSGFSDRQMSGR